MKASYRKYILHFKQPSGTSRGIMVQKETWFLCLEDQGRYGVGECGLLRGLSMDDVPGYEDRLGWLCRNIAMGPEALLPLLTDFPSIRFGLEQAFRSLAGQTPFLLYPSAFTGGSGSIPINGLIWMGEKEAMLAQIREKLEGGFRCLKLKIGALDFHTEISILKGIRDEYSVSDISLRVDANGAFTEEEAPEKLERLAAFQLHSIEQPIRQGNWQAMAVLCEKSPIPIALDEELIGITTVAEKKQLLQRIRPQYLILKPSLLGGFKASEEWISLSEAVGTGWWVTSALESNIGLNAIAQWTFQLDNPLPQGLGTGGLFTNNFKSPLVVSGGCLSYDPKENWGDLIPQILCT